MLGHCIAPGHHRRSRHCLGSYSCPIASYLWCPPTLGYPAGQRGTPGHDTMDETRSLPFRPIGSFKRCFYINPSFDLYANLESPLHTYCNVSKATFSMHDVELSNGRVNIWTYLTNKEGCSLNLHFRVPSTSHIRHANSEERATSTTILELHRNTQIISNTWPNLLINTLTHSPRPICVSAQE